MFSFIGSLTLLASSFGNVSRVTDVWNPIESRQFIGWWRDAAPDALTSSAYIGERAIYSSDFSAFTKRSYCPLLLWFFWPTYHIRTRLSICTSATAYSGTLFSLRWSSMEYRRCQPLCTRFIVRDDPHIKCLGFSHARKAVYGISKCKFCENLHLITLRSRLEACEKESSIFPLSRARGLRGLSWVRVLGFGCWARGDGEWADRPRLFSPSLTRACAPVEFAHDYLFPSPRARDTVSFGLDDILQTAASD